MTMSAPQWTSKRLSYESIPLLQSRCSYVHVLFNADVDPQLTGLMSLAQVPLSYSWFRLFSKPFALTFPSSCTTLWDIRSQVQLPLNTRQSTTIDDRVCVKFLSFIRHGTAGSYLPLLLTSYRQSIHSYCTALKCQQTLQLQSQHCDLEAPYWSFLSLLDLYR